MTKVLSHISYDNKNYIGILKSVNSMSPKIDPYITSLHDNIFDIVAEIDPKTVILSAEEYTQEFHDFVSETDKQVLLHFNKRNDENIQNVINFLDTKSNIKYISSSKNTLIKDDKKIQYEALYDSDIYYNRNQQRNDKIAVILSDNETNKKIEHLMYPNNKYQLLCFNNINFDYPENLGSLSDFDMANVLNEFKAVLDLTDEFKLEAKACGCPYIDKNDIEENLSQLKYENLDMNLEDSSFNHFINNILLKEITGE